MVTVTRFRSITDTQGHRCELSSWRALVARPVVGAAKEMLPGWAPALFEGNRRGARVTSVGALVLDHDDVSPLEQIAETWADFDVTFHTSFSHTAEHPKCRVIVSLDRSLTAKEHPILWAWAQRRDPKIDPSCKDAGRFWYVPAHRPGAPYLWRELGGALVEVDRVLRDFRPVPPPPPATPRRPMGNSAPTLAVDRARGYIAKVPGAISGQKGHALTFAVARALVTGFALEPTVALDLLSEWNRWCVPPWSTRELEHKIAQAAAVPSNKPNGWLLDAQRSP